MPVCRREIILEGKEGREKMCFTKDQKTIFFSLVTGASVIYIYEEDWGRAHVAYPHYKTPGVLLLAALQTAGRTKGHPQS